MALTLNDEQEKALRRWWTQRASWIGGPNDNAGDTTRNLHAAMAPLMKRWRYEIAEQGMLCSGMVLGPNGFVFRVQSEQAAFLCSILNGEENP